MTVHDPVCGMEIEPERAFAKPEHARREERDSLAESAEGYAKYAAETPSLLPRRVPAGIHGNAAQAMQLASGSSMSNQKRYIPALSFRWLTPLYDPVLKWGMREETFKHRLIDRARVQPGQKVLDLGCGTGTLTIMLKQTVQEAQITGVDGDPEVLSIARAKAGQAGVNIEWDQALAFDLPYPDDSFDVVVSSLVMHHLLSADKVRAFREARRILRPGGLFHVLDFGRPYNLLTRVQATGMRRLEEAADNFRGRILPMLREAGFDRASEAEHRNTIFGPIWFYEARKNSP